ncbi:MAG: excinuclease ABC subunit UvrC [Mycoplasma sp.]
MNNFSKILNNIPELPGCYLWKDSHDNIIYIGKAKNLKKRTTQYFTKTVNNRIANLVKEIANIDYIVVNNENESLILENNLIKEHKPKYNVLLKEGSNSYPYIVLTNEKNPKLIYTRNIKKFNGKAYGPFATTLQNNSYDVYLLLQKLFPFRKCNKIPNKECMFYHLDQCLAPCINDIDQTSYESLKKQLDLVFNNKPNQIIKELKNKELEAARNLEFEKAKMFLSQIDSLSNICNNQITQLNEMKDADIIGYYVEDNKISINIFNYVGGKLLVKHQFFDHFYGELQEVLESYLIQYYSEHSVPNHIYIDISNIESELLSNIINSKIKKPIKGLYSELLLMAIKNAKENLQKKDLEIEHNYNKSFGALNDLKKLLNMDYLNRIEMIDNSNLFLENCVSAVVVFKNAKPEKKLYRKYNIKSTGEKSDFHFMQEVVERRYSKLNNLPELLIVDGGKQQVSAAVSSLKAIGKSDKVKVIGLIKNDKHQTESLIDDEYNIFPLIKKSYLYNFLSNMQNEVHRYVINFYHSKSSKSKTSEILDNIPGLGDKTKNKLLSIYPNIYDLKKIDIETISQIIPKKVAILLLEKIKKEVK